MQIVRDKLKRETRCRTVRNRGPLVALAAALLGACAAGPGFESPPSAGIDVTLTPLSAFGPGGTTAMIPSARGTQLGYAAAVAATGGFVFVVDLAAPGLVRLDTASGEVRLLHELRDANTQGLHVSRDMLVLVVDRYNRAVLEFDQSGWERRRFRDSRLIPAPVDVTRTDWGSTILVADGLSQRVAMFDSLSNPTGLFTTTLSPVAVAASITAMAATENFVFVLDGASREVTQLDLGGRPLGTYGDDALLAPVAIAVDDCQRIFVADGHAAGLFVTAPEFYGSNSRAALPPGVAAAVTDLWVDDNTLYIAAGNLGVHVMAVDPPCLGS